ncbi:WYL domain protein [uncultured archaeon]|nr:WYL domain protein [uncultured archaeon]
MMEAGEIEKIIRDAIQNKLIVEIEYIRKDGTKATRMMEPFDIKPSGRSKEGPLMFWGWCLFHNRIEQRRLDSIVSLRVTGEHFDPKIRERTFSSPPVYSIPRDWQS